MFFNVKFQEPRRRGQDSNTIKKKKNKSELINFNENMSKMNTKHNNIIELRFFINMYPVGFSSIYDNTLIQYGYSI